MWDVHCEGTEGTIFECPQGRLNSSNCIHGNDLGVICHAPDLGVRDKASVTQIETN